MKTQIACTDRDFNHHMKPWLSLLTIFKDWYQIRTKEGFLCHLQRFASSSVTLYSFNPIPRIHFTCQRNQELCFTINLQVVIRPEKVIYTLSPFVRRHFLCFYDYPIKLAFSWGQAPLISFTVSWDKLILPTVTSITINHKPFCPIYCHRKFLNLVRWQYLLHQRTTNGQSSGATVCLSCGSVCYKGIYVAPRKVN